MPYASNQSLAVVGTTDAVIIGANPSRKAITVSPPSAGRVTITFGLTATLDGGETIYTATAPRTWRYEDVGPSIAMEVHAIADAAARTVGILETFEPRR